MFKPPARRVARRIAALPIHLKLSLRWLLLSCFVLPLFLLGNAFFVAFMLCQAANLVFGTYPGLRHGLVRLHSLSHLTLLDADADRVRLPPRQPRRRAPRHGVVLIPTVAASPVLDARGYRDQPAAKREPTT